MDKQAQIDATREKVFVRAHYRCEVCGKPATQLAHVVPQTKLCLKLYGARYIHHHANMRAACGLVCNAKLQAKRWEWDAKIAEVRAVILGESK